MIKRFFILLLAIVASVGMSWALTPLSGDAWDDNTKTLTVNADPGKNAYKDITEIEHVIINNGVTSIGNAAFYGCSSLTSVTLPSGLTTIGNDAFRETSLASVSLPSGLISIGNNAFNQCTSLASVTFPEGLATIDVGAFSGCSSLTSVTLPESLTTVNVGVFSGCTSLASVTILAPSLSTYGKSVFYDTASGLKIYVPAASVDTYKAGWSTYADKINPIAPAYETVMNLIDAIGTVELTAECKAKIDAARTAFDALSDGDKAQVTNIATLTQAETDYAALAAAAAAPVIAQMEALPTTIKLSTYFSTYDLMVAARAAYNALSAEVQAAVTNLSKLTNLEAAFAAIGGANEKLSKPFSVGEGQVVYFSHGNLQATYNGTNWSWAFAAHQYDYIGDTSGNIIINGNGTLSGAGTVDLFGWVANSSTVLTSGVAKYGVSNSDNVIDYGLGTTETLKGDWGVAANDANIGGYNDWRILSNDEWVYLFKTRTDAASKYGYATVDGKNGVIIIPDAFTDPMKNKGNLAFRPQNVDKGYSTNVYTTGGDWEAMEAAGAVFMPAAGRRAGTTMTVNEGTGFYWSSTPMSYQASYFMGFMGSNVVPNNDRYRYHGLSVRLVSNNAPVASTPLDSALVVKDLIEAIPSTITLEDACVKAINDARDAYNKLSGTAKGLIDEATLAKLTDAEAALTALYQAEADKVIAKINNIPTPVTLKLATRDSIENARAAYDALNAEQKLLVPAAELQKLTDAEAELATLNPGGGAPLPEGALTGAFSINADGSKIAFSKGNLQATYGGSDWTWAFAAHQYDVIGNAVANTAITGSGTVSANGTVDLFGWSTAATYYGINNTNVSGKHPGDFIDWGETIAEGWRTLTRDEWGYLFETRTDAASKYGHATVAGIHGIIILPDSYKGTAINADHSDWSNNIISAEDWAAYEANGVAFLPAAGSRLATSVNYVGEYAFYWTSTTYGEKWAYRVRFVPNLSPDYGDRVPGQSVRLVTAHTGSPTPLDSAQTVKDLIEAIPAEITLEDACVNAVQAARDAYNALAEATKGALDDATIQKLNQAITDYTALIQAGADEVIAKINNIPQPVTLKLATRDSIESARAAYDALTADQQALVTNYPVLTAAEEALAGLNPGGGMPAGALNGKFTINADGDQIAFAKGNLQATTEDLGEHWTWGFAANQWEVIGDAAANNAVNGNRTVSANGTVDLFGWSTPTTYYGIHNSTNSDYYSSDFREWGENITGATWKTLSPSDWIYIISTRADAAQKQGQATVNGVNGYIFLPDEWVLPTGLSFTAKPNNWTANVYEGDDWTAMENAGAVFLPKSSWRKGNTVSSLAYGYYWSSDYNNYSNAMAYYFREDLTITGTGIPRYAGIYVRLVTADAGSPSPLDSAQAVKDLIDAIPVPVTLDSKDEIDAARDAYDALADLTKGALDEATVTKLTDAEDAYAALIKEATDVIALINAIPQPVVYNEACGDSIAAAREAYDALSDELKPLVTNYPVLTDAEATYEALAPRIWTSGDCQVIYWPGDSAMIVSKLPGEGNGVMDNYANKNSVPWVDYQLKVKTLTIESGVTEIGSCAFYELRNLEGGLVIPEGVTAIHENGFRNCLKLTSITLPSTITLLGDNADAFNNCKAANISITADPNKLAWNEDFDDFIYSYSQQDVHKTTVCHVPVDFYEIYVAKFDQTVNVTFVGDLPAALSPAEHAAIEAVKDSIAAIGAEISYPESGAAIDAARSAYDALDDDLKPFVSNYQTLLDAEDAYADAKQAHDAVAAAVVDKINAIPVPVEYSSKAAIDTARVAYDALLNTQKALVPDSILQKLTDAEAAWAAIAAKVEHNVLYIGKDGELKNEKVALLHIPDPAPEFNGYEFVRWDVKAGDFLEEGLRIKAIYTPIITTNPVAYDSLMYNGMAQTLITAGVAKEGHIEYSLYPEDPESWSAELPKATIAGVYAIYYKLVREGHEDYMAGNITVVIAKTQVSYTAPVAYDTLVYNYNMQTLIEAGITNDGIFEYTLTPGATDSWNVNLPQAQDAGTYAVYYRVIGDINHFDSTAVAPVAVTIAKRDIVVEAPVAYDTLVYNAAEQTLIIAGSADFNVMEYSLDTTVQNCWSIELPKAVTADPYTVYYRVPGDDNHNEYEAQSIAAFIAQAPLTITAEDSTIIYGDAVPEFIATYSGWQGQDDETVVSNLAFSCAYQQGSYIGTYAINPNSATAHNYAITFVDGTLTVNKAHVYVSDAEAQIAKFADGHANAVVLEQGVLNGIKLNDPIAHLTTAAFSSADVAENLTITLFYELTGDAALLNNYNLDPTSDIFTNEGVIIEPFLPDNDGKPEDQEAEVKEGIEVYAYGYCDGSGYSLKYHLNSGYPDQYKIEFADSRFDNVDYTETAISGRDGEIYIEIPAEMPTGDYTMTVTFRDSRFDWLESQPFTVTFHVNLPETYVQPLFNNTIVLIDTCECFTDIQWYYRANSTELWQPIAGATGHYYHVDGELKGEYFVAAKVNGMPTFTCGQADMETLYGETKPMKVKAFPNPVVTATTVTVENAENNDHTLRVVNLMGVEVMKTTFEGNETVVDMSACTSGNYMITVDGIVVKVMKK